MPPVARLHHIEEGWSQHKQRAIRFYYDQHKSKTFLVNGEPIHERGRPYWAWVERPANGAAVPQPVGPIMPAGWTAPWFVPEKYIVASIGKVDHNGGWVQGAQSTEFFTIDYGSMVREDHEAMREYFERAVREAASAKMDWANLQYGKPLPFALELIVGRMPRSPKIGEACIANNDWILGQRMPSLNVERGKYEVEVDRPLARLIKMASQDMPTPEEAEIQAERQDTAASLLREQADLIALLRKDMAEMKAREEEREERRKADRDRMANARASKKGKPKADAKASSGTATVG